MPDLGCLPMLALLTLRKRVATLAARAVVAKYVTHWANNT
jgi:hypothetical protein